MKPLVLFARCPALQNVVERIADQVKSQTAAEVRWIDADAPHGWEGLLESSDVIFASPTLRVTRQMMERAPKLRALVTVATGTDNIDVSAASDLGIVVAHGPTRENVESMAEATVMLVLALLYDLHGAQRSLLGGGGRREPRMLKGRTLGLLGFGRIAAAVAARLSNWDVRIIGTGRGTCVGVEQVSLDTLIAESDVLSIHLPLTETTRNLLDRSRLEQMKPGAYLVNTARGGIVDELALQDLVETGRIGAIALDVFETEPLPKTSGLRKLESSILTPHNIGHTRESLQSVPSAAVTNIARVLQNNEPLYVRNPDVLASWKERLDRLSL